MAYPALPTEIIEEHIIDKLGRHPASLRACALVCRAWVNASQRRIFTRVEIRSSMTVPGHQLCDKFCDLLVTSPHIALHVTDLNLADGIENRRWMARSRQALSTIAPKLVNMNILTVSFATLPWNEAAGFRDIMRTLFRQAKLKDITLRGLSHLPNWDELFSMLNGCQADHVLLYAVTLDPALPVRASRRRRGSAIQRPKLTIGSLETNSSIQDLEDLALWADNPRSCVDISSLAKFSLDFLSPEDIAGCNQVLKAEVFKDLQIFEVVIEDTARFGEAITVQLDLSRVRHLQLTVKEIPYNWTEFGNVLQWYAHVFETCRSQSVEEVTLTCVQWARVNQNLDEQLAHWKNLDGVMARRTPNLHSVHLKTKSEFPVDAGVGKAFLEAHIQEMFPALLSKGVLRRDW